jgi:hypothetical protein
LNTVAPINSLWKALSGQFVIGCCIDRLSQHRLTGPILFG